MLLLSCHHRISYTFVFRCGLQDTINVYIHCGHICELSVCGSLQCVRVGESFFVTLNLLHIPSKQYKIIVSKLKGYGKGNSIEQHTVNVRLVIACHVIAKLAIRCASARRVQAVTIKTIWVISKLDKALRVCVLNWKTTKEQHSRVLAIFHAHQP